MHHCEEFRERITEQIIDREDLLQSREFQGELLMCSACAEFYAQAREMMDAISGVDLSVSPEQWDTIERRLRMRLVNHAPRDFKHKDTKPLRFFALAAAAAMVMMTVGLYRLSTPLTTVPKSTAPAQAVLTDGPVPLDPVTVDFLEESELLLRNVMKITPNDADDLAEAKKTARDQLADIEQRKEAAAEMPPVIDVMDTYETVLRDIRNVDERSAAEDIADIQSRIRRNGLIANIKAFQPNIRAVSFR